MTPTSTAITISRYVVEIDGVALDKFYDASDFAQAKRRARDASKRDAICHVVAYDDDESVGHVVYANGYIAAIEGYVIDTKQPTLDDSALTPAEKSGYPVLAANVTVPDGMMPIVIHRRDSGEGLVLVFGSNGKIMTDGIYESRQQVAKKIAAWNALGRSAQLYLVPGDVPAFRNAEVHAAFLRNQVKTAKNPRKLQDAIMEAQRYAMDRGLFWNVYEEEDIPVFHDENGHVIQRVVIYDRYAGL